MAALPPLPGGDRRLSGAPDAETPAACAGPLTTVGAPSLSPALGQGSLGGWSRCHPGPLGLWLVETPDCLDDQGDIERDHSRPKLHRLRQPTAVHEPLNGGDGHFHVACELGTANACAACLDASDDRFELCALHWCGSS